MINDYLLEYADTKNIMPDTTKEKRIKFIKKNRERIAKAQLEIQKFLLVEFMQDEYLDLINIAIIKTIFYSFYDLDYHFTDIKNFLRKDYSYTFNKEIIKVKKEL